MAALGHKFRGPRRTIVVPIVWIVLGIALAIATKSPRYGLLIAVFFGAFLMLIVRSWPIVDGTTIRTGGSRVDFARDGVAVMQAVKAPIAGKQLVVVISSPTVQRLAAHVCTNSKLVYRPADYAALSAALRSNPTLVSVADRVDYLVAATKEDRAAFYQQLNTAAS